MKGGEFKPVTNVAFLVMAAAHDESLEVRDFLTLLATCRDWWYSYAHQVEVTYWVNHMFLSLSNRRAKFSNRMLVTSNNRMFCRPAMDFWNPLGAPYEMIFYPELVTGIWAEFNGINQAALTLPNVREIHMQHPSMGLCSQLHEAKFTQLRKLKVSHPFICDFLRLFPQVTHLEYCSNSFNVLMHTENLTDFTLSEGPWVANATFPKVVRLSLNCTNITDSDLSKQFPEMEFLQIDRVSCAGDPKLPSTLKRVVEKECKGSDCICKFIPKELLF